MGIGLSTQPMDEREIPPGEATESRTIRNAVQAVRAGDHDEFREVVERYQGRIFSLTLAVTRNRIGAEEATQEAFIRAYRKLDLYDDRRPFYPWLATIAVRLAQNWLRRRALLRHREGHDLKNGQGARSLEDPLDTLVGRQVASRLWRSVQDLPQGERSSVLLFYRQGLSVGEAARVLGVTSGTVKTWLSRARRHLKKVLREESDPR